MPSDPEFTYLLNSSPVYWQAYFGSAVLALGFVAVLDHVILDYPRRLSLAVDKLGDAVTAKKGSSNSFTGVPQGCELVESSELEGVVGVPLKDWWVCDEALSDECTQIYRDGELVVACAF